MYKTTYRKIKTLFFNSLFTLLSLAVFTACSKTSDDDNTEKPAPPKTDARLISLTVKTPPVKTGYYLDETFTSDGLAVEGKYDDGTTAAITPGSLAFSGFNSASPVKNQEIKISYDGVSVNLVITVYPFRVKDGQEITSYVENETSVVIPSGIVKIATKAFAGKSMESITFPETLQEIGDYAFFNCIKLQNITLPSSLKITGEGVFDNCLSLTSADLSKTQLADISDYLFDRCAKLSDVKLPANATRIGHLTFMETTALKTLTLPETLRFIGLDAFRESGLEQISLPNNVKHIRQRAFLSCSSLAQVTTFGNYTHTDDGLPAKLESSAFQNVPAMTKFEIPQGIELLEQSIISNCPQLTEITIPASVKTIYFMSFGNTQVQKVTVNATTPPSPGDIFSDTSWQAFPSTTTTILVPAASVNAYKQAPGWGAYADIISGY